jgi:hypothetical protein
LAAAVDMRLLKAIVGIVIYLEDVWHARFVRLVEA